MRFGAFEILRAEDNRRQLLTNHGTRDMNLVTPISAETYYVLFAHCVGSIFLLDVLFGRLWCEQEYYDLAGINRCSRHTSLFRTVSLPQLEVMYDLKIKCV